MSKLINVARLTRFWTDAKTWIENKLAGYVPTESGKGLSTNDFTNTLKTNYNAAYNHSNNGDVHVTAAQKNAWDGKAAGDHTHTGYAASNHGHSYDSLTGKPTIPTAVSQLSDAADYAKKTDIASVYNVKGSKATYAELPTTGNKKGDVWDVTETGMNYVWTGTAWDALGSVYNPDIATDAEIDAIFAE